MQGEKELRDILFEFVKRASSKEATPEEVKALPEVARVLLASLKD